MNRGIKKHKAIRQRGFTLLEVVIALGLMGMLVGMIFRVARTSVELSQIVVEKQNATMERNAFFNLLENQFEQMPGNAVIRLTSDESRSAGVSRLLFTLTFQNVPMSFGWGDTPMTAEAIELTTVEQRDGYVDVILRFYEEKILENSGRGRNDDVEPVAEITLMEDLFMCECEVVDGSNMEQFTDWDNNGRLPLQVKFYCRFDPVSDIVLQSFWVVPKQNPEVFFREVMQQNEQQAVTDPSGSGSGDITNQPNSKPDPVLPPSGATATPGSKVESQ